MPSMRRRVSDKQRPKGGDLDVSPREAKRRKVAQSDSTLSLELNKSQQQETGFEHSDRELAFTKKEQSKEERIEEACEKKPRKKRQTKEEKEALAMPLASRTQGLRMMIGAHVSCAKGVQNSVHNALHIGGNAFAMFLKSQRKWDNPPLQDEHRDSFMQRCKEQGYSGSYILPHGSYLVNLAQADSDKALQAYNAFLDDLKRCDALGIKLYNFHPGSTGTFSRSSAIGRIAAAINRAHVETSHVVTVLEAMAGSGNVIGSTFEDLRDIIQAVEDKSRVGVCLDTCHIFAAGYDLRDPPKFKETMETFGSTVGFEYLRALHLNDSKAPLTSHRDLHQNIGLGFLGLQAFHNIMNDPRFENMPLVLETPIDKKDENGKEIEDKAIWANEIKLLESLTGMNADGEKFRALEAELSARGEGERKKFQEAFDKKTRKEDRKTEKRQSKLAFQSEA